MLNRNQLSLIHNDAFFGHLLDSLVELDLSDNNLQRIPTYGISNLNNLRKLYLNRNRIAENVRSDAFQDYSSREILLKLELAANKLTDESLSTNLFWPLTSLRELSLETNELTIVPSEALKNQETTLTNLNLGLNQVYI